MNDYEIVVGMEIHAELSTKSKIFCGCKNEFGAEPNSLCCPVCTGMPGALPILNRQVVEYAILMGHASHCRINNVTQFARKQYFYPDLPKSYQISQHDAPICEDGYLDIRVKNEKKRIGITQIHIEEDAGKLIHDDKNNRSLVDYNRCGVPLIEIVSEPDMQSAEEAKAFMESVAAILLYLGISDVKMQEGNLRSDVNVSVRRCGDAVLGARTEMKNMNSFGAVFRAIQYEAQRQIDIIRKGGTIKQETRKWDDRSNNNILLRTKEGAQDYRYFPEPDLPVVIISEEWDQELCRQVPELPMERVERYISKCGLSADDATVLVDNKPLSDYFDESLALEGAQPKTIANWLLGDVSKELNARGKEIYETRLSPEKLIQMIRLIDKGTISNTAGKQILDNMFDSDNGPEEIMKQLGIEQISDEEMLASLINNVMLRCSDAVADYKKGKTNAMGFLVGQCMRESRGQGNPVLLREMLEARMREL